MNIPRLYIILDRTAAAKGCGCPVQAASEAARAGARLFCLRDRTSTTQDMITWGRALQDALSPYPDTRVFVHGDPSAAHALNAHGFHRPGHGPGWDTLTSWAGDRLCASTHSLQELREAHSGGARMATLSPVYPTASKPGYGPVLGAQLFANIRCQVPDMSVWALGGITPERVGEVMEAGAAGVAVLGGVMAASDPFRATQAYVDALTRWDSVCL